MELILISSNKLKVILSKEEMKKYKLNSDCNISNISEKKHFSSLLDEIKRKSGFDTMNDRIYVELFESLRGGCEIFITRETKTQIRELISPKNDYFKKSVKESVLTYKFDCAEHLISAAKRLNTVNLSCESRLLSDEFGSFYLFLTFRDGYSSETHDLIFLDEYGVRLRDSSIRLYLGEHGKSICDMCAVEALSKI